MPLIISCKERGTADGVSTQVQTDESAVRNLRKKLEEPRNGRPLCAVRNTQKCTVGIPGNVTVGRVVQRLGVMSVRHRSDGIAPVQMDGMVVKCDHQAECQVRTRKDE